jgi:hypothetical protein
MPRFYFHLYECGRLIVDDEGREVSDLDSLRGLALTEAREVMAAEVKAGKLCLSCYIQVNDEQQRVVLSVPFREALDITG